MDAGSDQHTSFEPSYIVQCVEQEPAKPVPEYSEALFEPVAVDPHVGKVLVRETQPGPTSDIPPVEKIEKSFEAAPESTAETLPVEMLPRATTTAFETVLENGPVESANDSDSPTSVPTIRYPTMEFEPPLPEGIMIEFQQLEGHVLDGCQRDLPRQIQDNLRCVYAREAEVIVALVPVPTLGNSQIAPDRPFVQVSAIAKKKADYAYADYMNDASTRFDEFSESLLKVHITGPMSNSETYVKQALFALYQRSQFIVGETLATREKIVKEAREDVVAFLALAQKQTSNLENLVQIELELDHLMKSRIPGFPKPRTYPFTGKDRNGFLDVPTKIMNRGVMAHISRSVHMNFRGHGRGIPPATPPHKSKIARLKCHESFDAFVAKRRAGEEPTTVDWFHLAPVSPPVSIFEQEEYPQISHPPRIPMGNTGYKNCEKKPIDGESGTTGSAAAASGTNKPVETAIQASIEHRKKLLEDNSEFQKESPDLIEAILSCSVGKAGKSKASEANTRPIAPPATSALTMTTLKAYNGIEQSQNPKATPNPLSAYVEQLNILNAQNERRKALAEAEQMVQQNPNDNTACIKLEKLQREIKERQSAFFEKQRQQQQKAQAEAHKLQQMNAAAAKAPRPSTSTTDTPPPPESVACFPSAVPQSTNNHALADYQMQLMLLEQQNKRRLLRARAEQQPLPEQVARSSVSNAPDPNYQSSAVPQSTNNHALADYQMELMMLEQQNKRRCRSLGVPGAEQLEAVALSSAPIPYDLTDYEVQQAQARRQAYTAARRAAENQQKSQTEPAEEKPTATAITNRPPVYNPITPLDMAHEQKHNLKSQFDAFRTMGEVKIENDYGYPCASPLGFPSLFGCCPPFSGTQPSSSFTPPEEAPKPPVPNPDGDFEREREQERRVQKAYEHYKSGNPERTSRPPVSGPVGLGPILGHQNRMLHRNDALERYKNELLVLELENKRRIEAKFAATDSIMSPFATLPPITADGALLARTFPKYNAQELNDLQRFLNGPDHKGPITPNNPNGVLLARTFPHYNPDQLNELQRFLQNLDRQHFRAEPQRTTWGGFSGYSTQSRSSQSFLPPQAPPMPPCGYPGPARSSTAISAPFTLGTNQVLPPSPFMPYQIAAPNPPPYFPPEVAQNRKKPLFTTTHPANSMARPNFPPAYPPNLILGVPLLPPQPPPAPPAPRASQLFPHSPYINVAPPKVESAPSFFQKEKSELRDQMRSLELRMKHLENIEAGIIATTNNEIVINIEKDEGDVEIKVDEERIEKEESVMKNKEFEEFIVGKEEKHVLEKRDEPVEKSDGSFVDEKKEKPVVFEKNEVVVSEKKAKVEDEVDTEDEFDMVEM